MISFPSSKGATAPKMLQLTLCAWAVSSPWAFARANCNKSSLSICSEQREKSYACRYSKTTRKRYQQVTIRGEKKLPVVEPLAPVLAWSLAKHAWRQGYEGFLSYERLWGKTMLAPMLPIPQCPTPTKSIPLYIDFTISTIAWSYHPPLLTNFMEISKATKFQNTAAAELVLTSFDKDVSCKLEARASAAWIWQYSGNPSRDAVKIGNMASYALAPYSFRRECNFPIAQLCWSCRIIRIAVQEELISHLFPE